MQFMKDNGANLASEKEEAFKSGRMAPSTQECGKTTRQMVREDSFIQTETVMKDSGFVTKQMELDALPSLMDPATPVNGRMTSNMAKVKRFGLTTRGTRVCTRPERSTEMETSNGQMVPSTLATSPIITFREWVCTLGQTAENTRENGRIIVCVAKVNSLFKMAESSLVNTKTIRRTVMENSTGQMAGFTKVNGSTGNNTEKDSTSLLMDNRNMDNGARVKESDG